MSLQRLALLASVATLTVSSAVNGQSTPSALQRVSALKELFGASQRTADKPTNQPKAGKHPNHRVQIFFVGPTGMKIQRIDADGSMEAEPWIAPVRNDFTSAAVYRLKLSAIPEHEGVELFPTLEIAPVSPTTRSFVDHNTLPIRITNEDLDQVLSGNFVTKAIFLPDPKFQDVAIAGVESLVSTRLDPGVDPVAEADRRGSLLAVVRIGNRDVEKPGVRTSKHRGDRSSSSVIEVQGNEKIELYVGESRVLRFPRAITSLAVSENKAVQLLPKHREDEHRHLVVKAVSVGRAEVVARDTEGKRYMLEITVRTDARTLEQTLKEVYPQLEFKLTTLPNGILISGKPPTAETARRVVEIAEQFFPTVLNHMDSPIEGDVRDSPRSTDSTRRSRRGGSSRATDNATGRPLNTGARGQREIRELRSEVGALRKDVKRLIELLERSLPEPPTPNADLRKSTDAEPPRAAPPNELGAPQTSNKYRTVNFVVEASNGDAKRLAEQAERLREELAKEWLGLELDDWPTPCKINAKVNPRLGSGGATTYSVQNGTVGQFDITLQGSPREILTPLRHEIMHTLLASHFRRALPRWIDEGICSHVENDRESLKKSRHFLQKERLISLQRLLLVKEYPRDILPFFAQSRSLVGFLIERSGKQEVIDFIELGSEDDRWEEVFLECFDFKSLEEANRAWRATLPSS